MGVKEVGAYLRQLRKVQGLTQQALASAAGVHQNYIWRVETGVVKRPSNKNIGALVRVLRGSMEEVARLMEMDPGADAPSHELATEIKALPPEQEERKRREVMELTDELLSDPRKLNKWMGYGERLREED